VDDKFWILLKLIGILDEPMFPSLLLKEKLRSLIFILDRIIAAI
jgi:hypothetical protein